MSNRINNSKSTTGSSCSPVWNGSIPPLHTNRRYKKPDLIDVNEYVPEWMNESYNAISTVKPTSPHRVRKSRSPTRIRDPTRATVARMRRAKEAEYRIKQGSGSVFHTNGNHGLCVVEVAELKKREPFPSIPQNRVNDQMNLINHLMSVSLSSEVLRDGPVPQPVPRKFASFFDDSTLRTAIVVDQSLRSEVKSKPVLRMDEDSGECTSPSQSCVSSMGSNRRWSRGGGSYSSASTATSSHPQQMLLLLLEEEDEEIGASRTAQLRVTFKAKERFATLLNNQCKIPRYRSTPQKYPVVASSAEAPLHSNSANATRVKFDMTS